MQKDHFQLTCVAQKRLQLYSLIVPIETKKIKETSELLQYVLANLKGAHQSGDPSYRVQV